MVDFTIGGSNCEIYYEQLNGVVLHKSYLSKTNKSFYISPNIKEYKNIYSLFKGLDKSSLKDNLDYMHVPDYWKS